MASKKQDDKNLQVIREIVALPHNKHCFDCGQRGPTYVNMTIGAFVCTGCSGVLRGVTPPHRVKSISMTTFTSDEINYLRERGNEYNRKVWLGLHETREPPSFDGKDEYKLRDYLAAKYERKKWYSEPTDRLREEARQQNSPAASTTSTKPRSGSTLGLRLTKLQQPPSAATPNRAPPIQASGAAGVIISIAPTSPSLIGSPLPPVSSGGHPLAQNSSQLLTDIFSSQQGAVQPAAAVGTEAPRDDFANFSNFSAVAVSRPSMPLNPGASLQGGSSIAGPPAADKYSNLSDLFNMDSPASTPSMTPASGTMTGAAAPVNSSNVNWQAIQWGAGGPAGAPGGPGGGIALTSTSSSSSASGMNWGGSSSTDLGQVGSFTAAGSVPFGSTPSSGFPSATPSAFGGAASSAASSGWGQPATAQPLGGASSGWAAPPVAGGPGFGSASGAGVASWGGVGNNGGGAFGAQSPAGGFVGAGGQFGGGAPGGVAGSGGGGFWAGNQVTGNQATAQVPVASSNPFAAAAAPPGAAFGAQPAAQAFGAQPAAQGFGAQPAAQGFGAQPAAQAFGAQPAAQAFGAQPAAQAFGAQPQTQTSAAAFPAPFQSLQQQPFAAGPAFGSTAAPAAAVGANFGGMGQPQNGSSMWPVTQPQAAAKPNPFGAPNGTQRNSATNPFL